MKVPRVTNNKPEISLKKQIASWLFIIALLSILIYISFRGLWDSYSKGVMNRPYIWIGLVTWFFMGYYFHDLKLFLSKHKQYRFPLLSGFMMVYYLAISGRFPVIHEWGTASSISPIVAILKPLIVEGFLKKDK